MEGEVRSGSEGIPGRGTSMGNTRREGWMREERDAECCADILRAVQWGRGSGVGGEGGGGCVASEILNHTGAHGFLRGSREAGPVMVVLWERST